jgi:hypothetical protein
MPKKLLPVIYNLLAGYLIAICWLFDTTCQLWLLYTFFVNGRVYRKVYSAEDVTQQR